MPALKRYATGFACLGSRDLIRVFIKPEYTLTAEFAAQPFFFKAGYNILTMYQEIMRYCIGFSYLEVLQIASGLGFKKTKDGVDYNQERSINVIGVLTATNGVKLIGDWNMSINKWLKYYVYIRVIDKSSESNKSAS